MLYKFHKKIIEFKKLKQGWDGYDAQPIKQDVFDKLTEETVKKITNQFLAVGFWFEVIHLVPTPNGGVQFEAEAEIDGLKYYMEIEVD